MENKLEKLVSDYSTGIVFSIFKGIIYKILYLIVVALIMFYFISNKENQNFEFYLILPISYILIFGVNCYIAHFELTSSPHLDKYSKKEKKLLLKLTIFNFFTSDFTKKYVEYNLKNYGFKNILNNFNFEINCLNRINLAIFIIKNYEKMTNNEKKKLLKNQFFLDFIRKKGTEREILSEYFSKTKINKIEEAMNQIIVENIKNF